MKANLLSVLIAFVLPFTFRVFPAETDGTITEIYTFTNKIEIIDGWMGTFAVDHQFLDSRIGQITAVTVQLKITGWDFGSWIAEIFNGDYVVNLEHGNASVPLLNRVGRIKDGSGFGYSDSGFDVTFDDRAENGDIHVYRRKVTGNDHRPIPSINGETWGPVTGTWQPDGRWTGPFEVLDTDPRTGFLADFNGRDANGAWVLWLGDLELGGIGQLESWGLTITGFPRRETIRPQPILAMALEDWKGQPTIRFSFSNVELEKEYVLLGSRDLQRWEPLPKSNEYLRILVWYKEGEHEFSFPLAGANGNTFFRLMGY